MSGLDPIAALLLLPALTAVVVALTPWPRVAAGISILAALAGFALALSVAIAPPPPGPYFQIDALNSYVLGLNSFVAFTTSLFSASYLPQEIQSGRIAGPLVRFYHAMYQLLLFAMTLAVVANNLGLMWGAIELATLCTVALVGLYRTPAAIEAAWKYFVLGSVGVALALFGTILVYMAARPVLGEGLDGMVWTALIQRAREFDPAFMDLAFIFLLLGYGTKVGLVPLHAWLPDAHAEGPTPVAAVLSGLLLNVALYAVLRFKLLIDVNPGAIAPGPLMAGLGLLTVVFAAFMLYGRRDVKRLFAFSSIEHMGVAVFAFGIGGPLANFAGLLHMAMHSLTKSAIFFIVGPVTQSRGSQRLADITGLTVSQPWLGWSLVALVAAIAGLPPMGVFTSEFLIVNATFARAPLLTALLLAGLIVAFGALLLRLRGLAFGEPTPGAPRAALSPWPLAAHLGLVLLAGVYLPAPCVEALRRAAELLR